MRYETVTPIEAADICAGILEANYKESGTPGFDFCLHRETYEAVTFDGRSFAIVAFDGDKPVGVVSVFIYDDPHMSVLLALNDTIYCLPEYRARGVGGQLFVRAEREARMRGCAAFLWQVGIGSPLDRALARHGAPDQNCYIRRLA